MVREPAEECGCVDCFAALAMTAPVRFACHDGRERQGPRMTAPARARPGRSTGPRTPAGKARAAQNAWKHGLTIAIRADPRWRATVIALERKLVREGPAARHYARLFAEGTVELSRIAQARAVLAARLGGAARLEALRRLDRYEARAYGKKAKAFELMQGLACAQVVSVATPDVSAIEDRKTNWG
jgi:hypothetical protein